MEPLQKFCEGVGQPFSYQRSLDGVAAVSMVTMASLENNAVIGGQGCGKQLVRTTRAFNQSPYCCPASSQQSKLLYSLLSNCPDQLSCMPIIEHQTASHQTSYNGTTAADSNCTGQLSHPPFKFEFKGQLAPETGRDLLMPFFRQRSQSMGSNSWNMYHISRTSSHDSLTSYDSFSDETGRNHSPNQQSEALLEVTRKKLMNLLMGGNGEQGSSSSGSPMNHQDEDMRSLSQPGSPPNLGAQEVCRKYSEGSQRVHLKAKLQNVRARYDHLPVDLSCKRKKCNRGVVKQSLIEGIEADILPDEGIDESIDHSILKSVLTGRARSNSLSVFELRRLRIAGRTGAEAARNGHTATSLNTEVSQMASRLNGRQRVTLAKKNLLPVMARIADRLSKIVEFARSLPEFTQLSLTDQKALLTNACPRLLLLYMAETNLQFAVTTIPDSPVPALTGSTGPLHGSSAQREWETPTMQFVDYVQNFIRKCQMISVSANEYFYMRLITLFHAGMKTLPQY